MSFAFKFILSHTSNFLFLLLSTLLFLLSYPGFSYWQLGWFSFIPAFFVFYKLKNYKQTLFYGIVFGFLIYFSILYWLPLTLNLAGMGEKNSTVISFLFYLMWGLEFAVILFIFFFFKTGSVFVNSFLLSSIWVIIEFVKVIVSEFSFITFPWISIAYTQWNNLNILPYTYYGGMYVITFIIIFFQSLIINFYFVKKSVKDFLIKSAYVLIAGMIFVILGKILPRNILPEKDYLSIILVQPSLDNRGGCGWLRLLEINKGLLDLEYIEKKEKPDLFIWPENTFANLICSREILERFEKYLKTSNSYHIIGGASIDDKYVTAFLISPADKILKEYHKRILIPFAEYLPFRKQLGEYLNLGEFGKYSQGEEKQDFFEVKGFKIGMSICYETLFDSIFYNWKDVDLFVNITNDIWYLNTFAPYQHFAGSILRAVENRKYFLRAANHGVSAVISPYGQVVTKLGLKRRGIIKVKIPRIQKNKKFLPDYIMVYISMIIVLFCVANKLWRAFKQI